MYLRSYPSVEVGFSEEGQWDTVPRALYATLEGLSQESIPSQDYTMDDLEGLMKSLIHEQRRPGQFLVWGGSWSLIDIDEPAPSDVRVDLIFFPTYMVVSLMSLFWLRFPERASRIPGFQAALHKGFHFASARNLDGHGMEGDEQRMEAVRILNMGKVPQYLAEYVDEDPKCRPLYNALINCKEEIEEQIYRVPRTLFSLHQGLSVLPGKSVWKNNNNFIWKMQEKDYPACVVVLEAPYSNPPKEEKATDIVANEVAKRTGAACILERQSRQYACYTTLRSESDRYLLIQCHEILKEIFTSAKILDENGEVNRPVLHLIIRGIEDSHGVDVEISTRNGQSCSENLLKRAENILKAAVERNRRQWKTCIIGINSLFHGGSKYLELKRNGDERLSGFGQNYQALEIRISRGTRKTYLDEIIDGLCELTTYCHKM
jgi:hypothetical protein